MLKFTKDHEWIRVEGSQGVVGITHYAQKALGDVVFVDLPPVGKAVTLGGDMAVVESVKAASDVYAPVTGTIVAVNDALPGSPATVNESPEGEGWFCKLTLTNPAELDALMDRDAYDAFVASL
jgi:glycine cleavage system H protein